MKSKEKKSNQDNNLIIISQDLDITRKKPRVTILRELVVAATLEAASLTICKSQLDNRWTPDRCRIRR